MSPELGRRPPTTEPRARGCAPGGTKASECGVAAGGLGARRVCSTRSPSCLRTLGLRTEVLGYNSETSGAVESVWTREGGVGAVPAPCRQLRCPALFLGFEFPTRYLIPGQCRAERDAGTCKRAPSSHSLWAGAEKLAGTPAHLFPVAIFGRLIDAPEGGHWGPDSTGTPRVR